MSPRPELRPTGLEHLLSALRAAGLPVGPHEILRLHHAFALAPSLGQDRSDSDQLRDFLAAALTHDPAERRLFDDVYEPWAERWSDWARQRTHGPVRPSVPEGEGNRLEPEKPAKRQSRSRGWPTVARLASVALLAAVLSHSSGIKVSERRDESPQPLSGPKPVHQIWISSTGSAPTSIWRPDWMFLGLGTLALVLAPLLAWGYGRKSWIPSVLPAPLPGPTRLPLLPLTSDGPELLDASSAEALIWGVDRHITERLTTELDLQATVRETARGGGIPELRFEPERRLREVWLWLDGTAEDPALEHWAEEIAGQLERSGLPVRIGGFDGVPDELTWDEGQSLRPIGVEAHRETALVAVCTDGEVMLRQLEDERRADLHPLLSSLAAWQRLAVVDFSRRGGALAAALGTYGLAVVAPDQLPGYFGLGTVRLQKPVPVDPGEIRTWRAALALGDRPIDRATALALRRALSLEVSPWAFHLLADGKPNDPTVPSRLGGRLSWSQEGHAMLVAWLAENSMAEPSGVRAGSLFEQALDFWQGRLGQEAARRDERSTLEPWLERPAERYLRMERAILRLWRHPHSAAEELYELGSGELAEALHERLERFAPRDCRSPNAGTIPFPWRLSELDDRTCYLLAERGLAGVRQGALSKSGRFGLGLGTIAGLAALLLVVGGIGSRETRLTAAPLTVVEAITAPEDGLAWTQMSFAELDGGTFRMGSEEGDSISLSREKPAHDVVVRGFWIGETEVTNAQYRTFKSDHDADDASNLPAANVSWFDARSYCQALGKSDEWEYDLPTEAEWEYAARAGTTGRWSFGDDEDEVERHAWHSENSGLEAHEVATREPNPWGLYDTHGNVWEWVSNCYSDYAEHADPNGAVPDPGLIADSCHQSDTSGARRVLRGGAFNLEPRNLRSAVRIRLVPEFSDRVIGFRCVRRAGLQP